MSRWAWFAIYAVVGLLLVGAGWLVPAHLRAVDIAVIEQAGRQSPGLIERGLLLAQEHQAESASLLLKAAEQQNLPGREKLAVAVDLSRHSAAVAMPATKSRALGNLLGANFSIVRSFQSEPITDFILRSENRERLLEQLKNSSDPVAQELLKCRALSKTVIFPPSQSSAGQAFDAAIILGGLLSEEDGLSGQLRNAMLVAATKANTGAGSTTVEQALMDLMSLGQRFTWEQLSTYVGKIPDIDTLRTLTGLLRNAGKNLPVIFSALALSQNSAAVADYLVNFGDSGPSDIAASLRYGTGALNELLQRNQRLYVSKVRDRFSGVTSLFTGVSLRSPGAALGIKWLLYLAGGFLLALAAHTAIRVPEAERPLHVRGFHVAREALFALGFLGLVLILTEPFLAHEARKASIFPVLHIPGTGTAAAAPTSNLIKQSFMNKETMLTMLLFFVLQGLLYIACVVKLAEIRRQNVPPRTKLKLLENEEHLFDAGLYLGLVGTIFSFILVSVGVSKPSLMAAYSSTSFGIIFVSIFKILNLRPLKRKLVLQVESTMPEAPAPAPVHTHPLAAPL